VLLKNEDNALPLRPGARVVLAGSACSERHLLAQSNNLDWRAGDHYVLGLPLTLTLTLTLTLILTWTGTQATTMCSAARVA
jgi:hypothetical protein